MAGVLPKRGSMQVIGRFCEQCIYKGRWTSDTTRKLIMTNISFITSNVATNVEDQREHGKECTPVTATSIGRKDQEPDTKRNGDDLVSTEANTNPNTDRGFVTQQVRPTHAYHTSTCHEESLPKCSIGQWIARHGSAPCAQYSIDTRRHEGGPAE